MGALISRCCPRLYDAYIVSSGVHKEVELEEMVPKEAVEEPIFYGTPRKQVRVSIILHSSVFIGF